MSSSEVYVGLATIVVLGVGAQWIAQRFQFPALLLLLPAGLLAGPGLGLVEPQELFGNVFFPGVTLAVALLLFQSGLGLRLADLQKGYRRPVLQLITIGLVVTFAGGAAGAALFFGLSRNLALLLGAILVVSGPTVVGPLLTTSRVREPGRSVLLWEGTVLDPLGAVLGIVVLNYVLAEESGLHGLVEVALSLGVGVGVGLLAAAVLVLALARFLVTDEFEAPVGMLVAVAAFTVAELLVDESGLLAALVVGLALANQPLVSTRSIEGFGRSLEFLILGSLFVVLGAIVDVEDLRSVALPLVPFVLALVLLVRPIAVLSSTVRTSLDRETKLFAAWLAPRGIVAAATSSQFAIQLEAGGVDPGPLSSIAFGVILGTGAIYGLTTPWVASRLKLASPPPQGVALLGDAPWLADVARQLREAHLDVVVLSRRPEVIDACVPDVPSVPAGEGLETLRTAFADHDVGRLLVATTDALTDEVATAAGVELLGRANVYCAEVREEGGAVDHVVHGTRIAFAPGVTMQRVSDAVRTGARVRTLLPAEVGSGDLVLVGLTSGGHAELGPGRRAARTVATAIGVVGAAAANAPAPVCDEESERA